MFATPGTWAMNPATPEGSAMAAIPNDRSNAPAKKKRMLKMVSKTRQHPREHIVVEFDFLIGQLKEI